MISESQVNAILKLDPHKRYLHSLKMIADTEQIYSILDIEERWELAEVESKMVFFIWPAEEYIIPFLKGEWKNSTVEMITIQEFSTEIVPFLEEHNCLLNVFSAESKSGFVVTLSEFLRDLDVEMDSYS